jgi:hypothetical protein
MSLSTGSFVLAPKENPVGDGEQSCLALLYAEAEATTQGSSLITGPQLDPS